jgi:hypothetical protein
VNRFSHDGQPPPASLQNAAFNSPSIAINSPRLNINAPAAAAMQSPRVSAPIGGLAQNPNHAASAPSANTGRVPVVSAQASVSQPSRNESSLAQAPAQNLLPGGMQRLRSEETKQWTELRCCGVCLKMSDYGRVDQNDGMFYCKVCWNMLLGVEDAPAPAPAPVRQPVSQPVSQPSFASSNGNMRSSISGSNGGVGMPMGSAANRSTNPVSAKPNVVNAGFEYGSQPAKRSTPEAVAAAHSGARQPAGFVAQPAGVPGNVGSVFSTLGVVGGVSSSLGQDIAGNFGVSQNTGMASGHAAGLGAFTGMEAKLAPAHKPSSMDSTSTSSFGSNQMASSFAKQNSDPYAAFTSQAASTHLGSYAGLLHGSGSLLYDSSQGFASAAFPAFAPVGDMGYYGSSQNGDPLNVGAFGAGTFVQSYQDPYPGFASGSNVSGAFGGYTSGDYFDPMASAGRTQDVRSGQNGLGESSPQVRSFFVHRLPNVLLADCREMIYSLWNLHCGGCLHE